MAELSFPFDAGAGAAVLEASWQKMSRAFLRTGVVTGRLNQLLVSADGSGMTVSAASGQAQVEGFTYENDAALAKTIATANATNPRIDTVVVRLDRTANTVLLAVVTGTPAATPLQPTLSVTDTLHEMPLADVRVDAAVGVIAAGKVTDRRPFARSVGATQTGLRNRLINGDFRVNQRAYVSGTALAVGAYCFDRWKSTILNTALTFTAAPNGQSVTISTGGAIAEVIERADMPAGVYVVSWAGTATGRVYNSGASAPAYAASPVLVSLDGLADVVFEATAVGATQTLGTVQSEQVAATGTVADATTFERRPLSMELALCQRYFRRDISYILGMCTSATVWSTGRAPHTVAMRVLPTVTAFGAMAGWRIDQANGTAIDPTAVTGAVTNGGYTVSGTVAAGLVAGNVTIFQSDNGVTNYIDINAEL